MSHGAPPSLTLGPQGGIGATSAAASPLPPGRSLANLRTPKGTNFIRLAFAALFLLGFLGLVGYFLREHIVTLFPSVAGYLEPEVELELPAQNSSTLDTVPPSVTTTVPDSRAPRQTRGEEPPVPVIEAAPPKKLIGFDPAEAAPNNASSSLAETTPGAPAGTPILINETPAAPAGVSRPPEPSSQAVNSATSSSPPPVVPEMASKSDTIIEEDAPAEALPAVTALKQFLKASSVSERLSYTLGAEIMKPLMERYYSRAVDGPVLVDRIEFIRMDPNPELGSGRHCIFSLENKTWEYPVPVMLEEQPDGFKVDWLAFVEFKDRLLEKFFQSYQEGPARFHVGIIRHHYFEDNVPNIDRKYAFRVSPAPPNIFQASVFLDKESPLAQQLRTRLPWETHVWAVVELEWKKLGTQQWVELTAVPQMHWYSLPSAPRPISTSQKPNEQEMPPGISKNGVGSSGSPGNLPPPGISKSSPGLPPTVRRPLPAGR